MSSEASTTSTVRYFAFTFLGTWALQLPAVAVQRGLLPGDPNAALGLAALGIFAPLVVATWLTHGEAGKSGVGALYARLTPRRAHLGWALVGLLVPALLLAGGLGLFRLAGWPGEVVMNRGAPALLLGLVICLAEEVGWRGYALPRLIAHYGAFGASGILGVLWALWHIPMLLGQGVSLSLLPTMVLLLVGGSLFFTWLAQRSSQSLFVAVLTHLGVHLNNSHAALPGDHVPLLVHTVVFAALGLGAALLDRSAFPEFGGRGGQGPRRPGGRLVRHRDRAPVTAAKCPATPLACSA